MKSPQPTTLQVTQTLAPGQQIAVRTVAPAQPGQGIKPTVTLTNRPMQGLWLSCYIMHVLETACYIRVQIHRVRFVQWLTNSQTSLSVFFSFLFFFYLNILYDVGNKCKNKP